MSSANRLPPPAAGYPPMLSSSSSDSVATTSSSVSSSTSYTSSCSSCTSYSSSSCTASSSRSPQQQQQQRYSSQKRANASESTFSTCSCSSCSQCGSSCSGSSSCSGRDSYGRCSRCAASCCSSSWSSSSSYCDCSVCRQSNSSSDIGHHRPLQHHNSPLLAYDQSVLREQYDQLLYSAGLTGGMLKLQPPGTRVTVRRSDADEVPREEELRPREGTLLQPLSPPPPVVAAAPAGPAGTVGTTAEKHEEEPIALTTLLRQLKQLLDTKQQQQLQKDNDGSSEGLTRQRDEAQQAAIQTTMMMTMMQKMVHEASLSGAVSLLRSEETESRISLREEERDAWSALVVPLLASPSSHSTFPTTAPSWFTAFLAATSFSSPAVGSSTGAQSNEQLHREVETECDQLRAQLVEEEQEQRFGTWQQYHHETMEGSRQREQREVAQLRDALETERLQHVLELQQLTEAHHAQQEQQEQHLADRAAWHDNALATRFLHSLQALVEAETVQRVQFLEWLERDAFHALEVLHQESSNRLVNHAASIALLRVQHEDALAQVEQRAQRHVEQLQARIEQLAAVAYEQQCRLRKLCQLEGQLVSVQSAMTQSRRGEEQSYQQQQQQQQPEVSANAGREAAAPSSQQMMRSAQQIANNNNNNPGADEFGFVKRKVFASSSNAEGFEDLPVHERYHRAELAARRVVVQVGKVAAAGGARTQQ